MKNLHTLITVAFIFSSSCSSPSGQAMSRIKNMKPETYYSDKNEIELIKAIDNRDFGKMNSLISSGVKVDVVGKEEMTPLAWALSKQNLVSYKYLLENGANPNLKTRKIAWNDTGHSVMEFASLLENSEYLILALHHGGDPNAPNSSVGATIVFTAIDHKRNENIKVLAKYRADLNRADAAGFTPLMHCVTGTKYDLALLLLKLGADPKIKNREGRDVGDLVSLFGDRGIKVLGKEKEQGAYFEEFSNELKKRGLIKPNTKLHY